MVSDRRRKATAAHRPADAPRAVDALCGCDATEPGTAGKAPAVDPALKAAATNRLRRIEGQVRGLQRMVTEERYCPEILTQMASVQEALRAVARGLMGNHLKHCVARARGRADAESAYGELLELIFKQSR